jgi:hypothetical protein
MLFLVIGFLHGLFDQVLNVLKRISDEDCLLLGLNPKYARPDWMILQVLPVPPPPVRPSVMMDTSSRSEVSLIPIYFLCPKINIFLEIFRQIRTVAKKKQLSPSPSLSRRTSPDFASYHLHAPVISVCIRSQCPILL